MGGGDVQYREIAGYPGRFVGSDGSVWTCLVRRPVRDSRNRVRGCVYEPGDVWRKRVLGIDRVGRPKLRFSSPKATILVCKLVMEAFVGPRPEGMECCHEDGNPANNCLANLRWGTHKSNTEDMIRHGRSQRGERQRCAKLTTDHVRMVRRLKATGQTNASIGRALGVSKGTIRNIVIGKTWKHVA